MVTMECIQRALLEKYKQISKIIDHDFDTTVSLYVYTPRIIRKIKKPGNNLDELNESHLPLIHFYLP